VSSPRGFPWPINRWRASSCSPCSSPPIQSLSDALNSSCSFSTGRR
jgi:hypothetical protein